MASGAAQTDSDADTDLQYFHSLAVAIGSDKSGGIYVLPATIRDTRLSEYTYMSGLYCSFETVKANI